MPEPMSEQRLVEILRRLCSHLPAMGMELRAEVGRLREENRRHKETIETSSRGWRIEVAEVERLRDQLKSVQDHAAWVEDRRRTAERERDAAREQVKRADDVDLIRLAISDPGAFVKRERFNDGDYETVPAWGARAVLAALDDPEPTP